MSIEDFIGGDSDLFTTSTSSPIFNPQSQPLISSLIPNSIVTESTSTSSLVPQQLEVYFKEGIIVHNSYNRYAARKREFNLGPFHPSLGPVPLDATIIQKLNSPFLETLLSNYKNLAFNHLVPPTTIELPDIVDHVTKWEERYPHILYNICFPAQIEWQNRLKKYSYRMTRETAVYTDWEVGRNIDYLNDEAGLADWTESIMYLQIEKSIHDSYLLWCHYSDECIISMEQVNIDLQIQKSNDFYDRIFKLFGATHEPYRVAKRFAIHGLYTFISEYGIDRKRLDRYAWRPHYLDYPPPIGSFCDSPKIEISSIIHLSNSSESVAVALDDQSAGAEEYLDPHGADSLAEKLESTSLIEDNGHDRSDVEGQLRSRKGWSILI